MKTIEEKAKAYDEAIKKAAALYKASEPMSGCNVIIETLFPELKESGDEKMMKEIIELVMQPIWKTEKEFYRRNELCAWLKKQGEHANFLSKIQVGDKVTRNEDGVLVNLSQLKRVAKPREKQCEQKFEIKTAEESLGIDSNTYNKIVEECLFGEQKPADTVEPKFKVGDKIHLKPEYRMPSDDTPIANTVKEIIRIDDKHYRFDGSYIFIEDQDKYELAEQKTEENKGNVGGTSSNSEWGEEDKGIIEEVVSYLINYSNIVESKEDADRIEYLIDKIQDICPHQKQEWSEDDKRKIDRIYSILRQAADTHAFSTSCRLIGDKECMDLQDFLKSIRPQKYLIPSEEEIEKAAQEWDSKANFNPFYMTMEGGKPTGVKQSITTHKESFKAGIYWILKSLRCWKPSDEQKMQFFVHGL